MNAERIKLVNDAMEQENQLNGFVRCDTEYMHLMELFHRYKKRYA